ncbi:nicotinate-nucleotide adenylyltransferase [Anaerolinea thermophila]|uniref:Probable nicotinate-nucleotide adenylyltransferase n=1 Tax=Anaerolinea thermophila (strain DSM 14523 / JCM 11388 / NBRC 100420 / UNI-1) TaxID=926569 RepID=E8N4I7_ANATU|nr:nicotinate-nucleotide adenylyltransferase [Anaerolinea thermophila]BAJ63351.1 putative nicotinate-nucleotide adenylyltransferase [Anaerolinea thermophila UNI-1]
MAGLTLSRVGVFGGTFDPPHMAHLALAEEALHQLNLSQVLWMITPNPPHKRGVEITPFVLRLEMLKEALKDYARFEISTLEAELPPPQYAVETVRLLREKLPDSELFYLMGEDSLRDLPLWHQPAKLVSLLDGIGVLRRPEVVLDWEILETSLPGLREKVFFFNAPLLQIASHEIRQRISSGQPYRYMVPEGVARIIEQYHLYQFPGN